MPNQEEEDKEAKRKAREERRNQSGSSSRNRRESSDRREKDRARRDREDKASSTPGAYASAEISSPRSKKGSVKSRSSSGKPSDSIDKSDRSDRHSRSSGKSRTSKPASVPGAVPSSTLSPQARRERRKAGVDDSSSRSNRSTPVDEGPKSRSSGKSRSSRPASSPGAVSSSSSPHSRKERRKRDKEDSGRSSSRSTTARNSEAMQHKLRAAGLLDDDDRSREEVPSKPVDDDDNKNEGDEILLQATAVDEETATRPKERDVELVADSQEEPPQNEEPLQKPAKRRYGVIVLVVLILGACAGAGAYFGTQKTEAGVPESTANPAANQTTSVPTANPPTDPPTQTLKYPPPKEEDCLALASGNALQSENTTYTRNHHVVMDVVPLSGQEIEAALEALQKAMQERLIPALAGCSDTAVDDPRIRYVVLYGTVTLRQVESSSAACSLDYSSPCYVAAASLVVELKGRELPRFINGIISEVLDVVGAQSLVTAWKLESHFTEVIWTDVRSSDITDAPSSYPTTVESDPPTLGPTSMSVIRATNEPTLLVSSPSTHAPSVVTIPTKEPTGFPSPVPTTTTPTAKASEIPTLAPVIGPTDLPSSVPTKAPTISPSKFPTSLPSVNPTGVPTIEASSVPTTPPTFGPIEGDELLSSHYVHYSRAYYGSRADAEAGCEAKGLELCSQSAITNFELCAAGWLTDGAGWWMNSLQNPGVCGGIGYNPASWAPEDQLIIGAYCCGRPLYLPDDRPAGCCAAYIYFEREAASAACQSRGMGLCSKQQIEGYDLCSYGWTSDWAGLWSGQVQPGCPYVGFGATPADWGGGAYCCVEPDPTPAPTVAPSPTPSNWPSSNPTFEPMEGDHLLTEHYVYWMPDDVPAGWPNYPYTSREEAQAACETKGLTLCSVNAITNFELCAAGYLTDGMGWWMNQFVGDCGGIGYNDASSWQSNLGAYCCGRPHYLPDDRPANMGAYIYSTRESALVACRDRGLGLCSREQIQGFQLCAYGWTSDWAGAWVNSPVPGCPWTGFGDLVSGWSAGAYCCAEP